MRESRARRRAPPLAPAPVQGGCHAPASACNCREVFQELLESWDTVTALSRAGLKRRINVILGGSGPKVGGDSAVAARPSRAGLFL